MAGGTAEAAAAIIAAVIPEVRGSISSGSTSMALLRWRGYLNYRIEEIHGKVVIEGKNDFGGTIGVTKRDAAFIGAEFNIYLYRFDLQIAKIYLTTYYSGGSAVQLIYGDEWFSSQYINEGSSTALILVYKSDVSWIQSGP